MARALERNVLIYDGDRVRSALTEDSGEDELKSEWCRCLRDGPGVFVVHQAFPNSSIIDRATAAFNEIIAEENAAGINKGDHFGNNVRIWNSLQKSCIRAPELMIDYYANPILSVAARSWLGPQFQITAQVNIVKPGGSAQSPHRDYHLGFQSNSTIAQFPAHAQWMSQFLTLQGAVAHSDMPVESGPTMLLPYSHHFTAGYMAFRIPEFAAYFERNKVQLPLQKGDALFFSPALFHGAGANTSSEDRIANLLQISSAFGRTMEALDHSAMLRTVFPVLLSRIDQGAISDRLLIDTVAAIGDGYSFPTNLDSDPPIDGNAPETMQELALKALQNRWQMERFEEELASYRAKRRA